MPAERADIDGINALNLAGKIPLRDPRAQHIARGDARQQAIMIGMAANAGEQDRAVDLTVEVPADGAVRFRATGEIERQCRRLDAEPNATAELAVIPDHGDRDQGALVERDLAAGRVEGDGELIPMALQHRMFDAHRFGVAGSVADRQR
jgi:hypothetical protein